MASDTPARSESLSGLTPAEAQQFHKLFIQSFLLFTAVAVFAHFLVAILWRWPWFPNEDGTYGSLVEGVSYAALQFSQFLG